MHIQWFSTIKLSLDKTKKKKTQNIYELRFLHLGGVYIVLVSHRCGLRVLRCIMGLARGRRKLLWHDGLSFSAGHLSWSFILWRLLDVPCIVSLRPSLEHILTTTSWTKIQSHNEKKFCCQMLMVTLRCRERSVPSGLMYPRSLGCISASFMSSEYGQGNLLITLAESLQLHRIHA